jgi:hypothetical protein
MKSGKRAILQEMLNLLIVMMRSKHLFSGFFRQNTPSKQENQ